MPSKEVFFESVNEGFVVYETQFFERIPVLFKRHHVQYIGGKEVNYYCTSGYFEYYKNRNFTYDNPLNLVDIFSGSNIREIHPSLDEWKRFILSISGKPVQYKTTVIWDLEAEFQKLSQPEKISSNSYRPIEPKRETPEQRDFNPSSSIKYKRNNWQLALADKIDKNIKTVNKSFKQFINLVEAICGNELNWNKCTPTNKKPDGIQKLGALITIIKKEQKNPDHRMLSLIVNFAAYKHSPNLQKLHSFFRNRKPETNEFYKIFYEMCLVKNDNGELYLKPFYNIDFYSAFHKTQSAQHALLEYISDNDLIISDDILANFSNPSEQLVI